jgi:hypothetical protein
MAMKNWKAGILSILFLVAVLSIVLHVHIVRDSSGATIYSRENEAYIFMGESHAGWRLPYIEYPFAIVGDYFGAVTERSDELSESVVLHITPASIDRQIYLPVNPNHSDPLFITPFDDGLYGMCPGLKLCKWTGTSFEPATSEQEQRIGGIDHLLRGDREDHPVNGWVIRSSGRPGDHFVARVGKEIVITMENHNKEASPYAWVTIEMLRAGQQSVQLYNVDGRKPRFVTKATYDRLFSTSSASLQAIGGAQALIYGIGWNFWSDRDGCLWLERRS